MANNNSKKSTKKKAVKKENIEKTKKYQTKNFKEKIEPKKKQKKFLDTMAYIMYNYISVIPIQFRYINFNNRSNSNDYYIGNSLLYR